MSPRRWDTGVELRWNGGGTIEAAGALTIGSLSAPLVDEDNDGRQVAARVVFRPVPALTVGLSASRAAYLTSGLTEALGPAFASQVYRQRALGIDATVSAGHWQIAGELVSGSWDVPALQAPVIDGPLGMAASFLEGRYRLHPRWQVAARVEHVGFSRIRGTLFGAQPTTWDAPVTRVEAGGGYYVTRQLIVKLVYQHNWRDGGRARSLGLPAAQVSFWF
jgi:hypothetical protein